MKANKFVKENGIEKCKRLLDDLTDQGHTGDFYEELKRIVESYDLIQSIGGLDKAKLYLRVCLNSKADMVKTKGCIMVHKSMLKQAIADVESFL